MVLNELNNFASEYLFENSAIVEIQTKISQTESLKEIFHYCKKSLKIRLNVPVESLLGLLLTLESLFIINMVNSLTHFNLYPDNS